jgi:Right handed beta helix region
MFSENYTAGQAGHVEPVHEDISRTLNSVGVSVRHSTYGAVGNDTNDDTTEIQAAINAAPAGSTVLLPPNASGLAVYRTSSALTVNKPLRLLGYGSTIKNVGSGNVLDISGTTTGVVVEGLTLDGQYPTRTTGRGLAISGATRPVVRNVRVQNAGAIALSVNSSTRFRIEGCEFENCRLSAIRVGEAGSSALEDFWIVDNWIKDINIQADVTFPNDGHGAIQFHGGGTVTIRRGTIVGNNMTGFRRVGIGADFITDSTFAENLCWGSHTGESMALTGARNRIVNNTFNDSTQAAGFLLYTGTATDQTNADTVVANNTIYGPGSGNQGIALVPAVNSTGVAFSGILIEGNRCKGWAQGIQAYAGAGSSGYGDDGTVLVRDNILTGNTGAYSFGAVLSPVLRGNLTAADTIDA